MFFTKPNNNNNKLNLPKLIHFVIRTIVLKRQFSSGFKIYIFFNPQRSFIVFAPFFCLVIESLDDPLTVQKGRLSLDLEK